MNYIINKSKPSILFFLFIALMLMLVIGAPKFHFVFKLFLVLCLLYLIDNSVIGLIEKDGLLNIQKGYLFRQRKIIEMDKVKSIKVKSIYSKGDGNGYNISFTSEVYKVNFKKFADEEEIQKDIKNLEAYIASKYNGIVFQQDIF